LHHAEDIRARSNGRVTLRRRQCVDTDLLDLERDDVAVSREIRGGVGVVELRGDDSIRDRRRGTLGVGIERAAIAVIRPSCPPPRIPIVEPGGMIAISPRR
jgi:hypothetical protein